MRGDEGGWGEMRVDVSETKSRHGRCLYAVWGETRIEAGWRPRRKRRQADPMGNRVNPAARRASEMMGTIRGEDGARCETWSTSPYVATGRVVLSHTLPHQGTGDGVRAFSFVPGMYSPAPEYAALCARNVYLFVVPSVELYA